jgi:hypothetical protein
MFNGGNQGLIYSEGATVTVPGRNMESASFTPGVAVIDNAAGFVKIKIPAGETRINQKS